MKNAEGPIYGLPGGLRIEICAATRAAFGPSTSGLRFAANLARTVSQQEDKMARALDVGFGSGILSLVCAAKGFEVHAVDIVAEACEAAEAEFQRNNLRYSHLSSGGLEAVSDEYRFDLIVCNPPLLPTPSDPYGLTLPQELVERLPNLLTKGSGRAHIYLTDNLDIGRVLTTAKQMGLGCQEVWSAYVCITRKEFWARYQGNLKDMRLKERGGNLFLRGICFEFRF